MTDLISDVVADLRTRAADALHDAIQGIAASDAGSVSAFHHAEELADAVLAVIDDEAIDRMAQHYVDETHIRALEIRDGATLKLKAAQDMAAIWVGTARTMLAGAENYSETEVGLPSVSMDVSLAGEYEKFTLTVQRAQKPTPHQLRQLAEKQRDEALAEVDQLRVELAARPPAGKPRAMCPTCERSIQLNKDGTYRYHSNCESSGTRPS